MLLRGYYQEKTTSSALILKDDILQVKINDIRVRTIDKKEASIL